MLRKETTIDDLREHLRAELIGRFRVGQVVQGDVKVPARLTIPQVSLGPGDLGGTPDGRIHRRGRGRQSVNQARTLLTRRIQHPAILSRVGQGAGGAHNEILDNIHLLTHAHRSKKRIRLDTLQDDRTDTRHLRGRHRGARGLLVRTVRYRGENVATGRSDFRLEAQIWGNAPRGELRGLVDGGLRQNLALSHRQVMVGGLQHGLAIRLRDKRGGHVLGRQVHDDEGTDRNVVVDEDTRGVQVVQVLDLLLVGHVAARDKRNLAGEAVRILFREGGHVLLGGESRIYILVGAGGQVGEVGDLLAVHAARTLVADILPGCRESIADERVLDGGDGDHRGVSRGFVNDRGVGV